MVNLSKNNNLINTANKVLDKIPFGILCILLAILEWLGFALAFMIIPALFAWLFWFWATIFGIFGMIFKKRFTSCIGLILCFIPIIIILAHFLISIIF